MQTKTLVVAVLLSLSVLLAIPTVYVNRVHAAQQCCLNAAFSATGPRQTTYVWKTYDTDTALFHDFDLGLLDIVDGPDDVSRLNCNVNPACDENNANYYVTNAQPGFDLDQLDISHQVSFLGIPEFCSRALGATPVSTPAGFACSPGFAPQTPSIVVNSDVATACGGVSSNQFSLTVHLKNFEQNLALVKDPYEKVTAIPTAGTAASAQSSTGTYALGCLSSLPPTYSITTNVFGDTLGRTANVPISTSTQCLVGLACDVDLRVDYNSPSTKEPTTAMIHIGRALGHLVDKADFRLDPIVQGNAICPDIFSSSANAIMNSIADPTLVCGLGAEVTGPGSPALAANSWNPNVVQIECPELATANFPITTCTPVSLYHLQSVDIGACDATVAGTCSTNSLGVAIPSATTFPSAGRLGDDNVGGVHLPPHGYPSSLDLAAACDEFALAGITLSGGNCNDVAHGNVVGGATARLNHNCAGTTTSCRISFIMRKKNLPAPARPEWATIVWDTLNFLFGTGAPGGGTLCGGTLSPTPGSTATCQVSDTNPHYYTIGQIGAIVFQSQPTWNLYSGSESTGSTPDALLFSTHSQFASNFCGGPAASFPGDYDLFCDPITDTYANAGEFSATLADSFKFFQNTGLVTAAGGYVNPMLIPVNRFLALNAFNTETLTPANTHSSLVPGTGRGFEASTLGSYFTLLNMRPNGIPPADPLFAAGRTCGSPGNCVRRSLGGTVLKQNIFTSDVVWEADLINEIWDPLLNINPLTAGSNLQLIDWMTKSHSSQFDALSGLNTQVFNLRNDICWQDSTVSPVGQACDRPVTADDVCFTIGMEEKGPGLNFVGTQDVVSCTYPDPQTVVVVHRGLSAFQDLNVGTQSIIPAHLWQTACGWVAPTHSYSDVSTIPSTVVAAPCTQAGFDPIAVTFNGAPFSTPLPSNVVGLLVGSGPLMCVQRPQFVPAGQQAKIGGGCAATSTGGISGQALGVSATETFVAFPFYSRCCGATQSSPLQPISWADFSKHGKVTIVDASALSFAFGTTDAADGGYFVSPLYGTSGIVDIGDAAFLASQFDSGTIAPCVSLQCPGPPTELTPGAPLLSPDPALDPYQVAAGLENLGCVANSVHTQITCTFADKSNQLSGVSAQLDGVGSVVGVHALNGQTTYTFSFASGSHTLSLTSKFSYSYSFTS